MSTRDSSAWMWHDACLILDRAERMQREFFRLGVERRAVPTWQPPVDILESESELMIIVALPGVNARDLDVRVEGGTLVVSAVRSLPATGANVIRRLEIPHGRFERSIVLEGGALQLDQREFIDGCLKLLFHKIG